MIWLLVGVGTGISGLLWLYLRLPLPQCTFHQFTGYPCPTCGATRSTLALLKGDFLGATATNPLYVLGLLAAVLYLAYAAVVVIGRLPRLRQVREMPRAWRWLRIGLVGAICANWAWLIARGI